MGNGGWLRVAIAFRQIHCYSSSLPCNLTSQIDQLKVAAMREIQSSDARAHLPQLLSAVERGETRAEGVMLIGEDA